MDLESPYLHSQKLIRCTLVNKYGEQGVRLIEIENFRLWEYMMVHKHGARILHLDLSLWVCDQEYRQNEDLFDRSGEVEPVNRLVLELFDEEYGFASTVVRYARAGETEQLQRILQSHVPSDLKDGDGFDTEIIAGHSILQRRHLTRRPMLTGLEARPDNHGFPPRGRQSIKE